MNKAQKKKKKIEKQKTKIIASKFSTNKKQISLFS